MQARGAVHVHTTFSHDGRWSPAEMADFFRARNYQFVCITEHSQDMDEAKIEQLHRFCGEASSDDFCVIPGIEYSCSGVLHLAGAGCELVLDVSDPVRVARSIREAGGFAVLAHPRRLGWHCEDALLAAVHAVETWNVRYDGKFLPVPEGMEFLGRARVVNSAILAAAGLDVHGVNGFYSVRVEMDVCRLERTAILDALRTGEYTIASPFWRLHARGEVPSGEGLARLRTQRGVLDRVRGLRDRLLTQVDR